MKFLSEKDKLSLMNEMKDLVRDTSASEKTDTQILNEIETIFNKYGVFDNAIDIETPIGTISAYADNRNAEEYGFLAGIEFCPKDASDRIDLSAVALYSKNGLEYVSNNSNVDENTIVLSTYGDPFSEDATDIATLNYKTIVEALG